MKRSTSSLLLSLGFLAAGIGYLCRSNSTSEVGTLENGPVQTEKKSTFSPEKPASKSPTFHWKKGAALAYNLKIMTSLGETQTVVAGGIYHLAVMDDGTTSGKVELATIFENASYATNGVKSPYFDKMMQQVPCVLSMTPSGKILGLKTPSYLAGMDQEVLKAMNAVQVVLAVPNQRGFWVDEEQDSIGTASVTYGMDSDRNLHKQRKSFLRIDAQGVLPTSELRIDSSNFLVQLGETWLKSMRGEESMTFSYQGKPAWQSRMQVDMTECKAATPAVLRAFSNHSSADIALKAASGDLPEIIQIAGSGSVSDLDNAAVRSQAVAGISFDNIIGQTAATIANAKSHADRVPAIEQLRDWLLGRPEEASKLASYLLNPKLSGELTAGILHALELSSSSVQSQAVLGAILSKEGQAVYSRDVLLQAAVAAGGVGEVLDQPMMDNLYNLAFNPGQEKTAEASDSALLALGILAKGNPAIRERLASELLDTLHETTPGTEGYVATALMALSNGGVTSAALDTTAQSLFQSSTSPAIRAEALAYISSIQEDPALARAALTDATPAIQSRAVEILTGRNALDAESANQLTAIVSDASRDESLRTQAAQQLKRYESEHPSISQAYQQALAQTPSEEFKNALLDLLKPVAQN